MCVGRGMEGEIVRFSSITTNEVFCGRIRENHFFEFFRGGILTTVFILWRVKKQNILNYHNFIVDNEIRLVRKLNSAVFSMDMTVSWKNRFTNKSALIRFPRELLNPSNVKRIYI